MDFPDAVTGSLRHTTDQVRGILEKTRGDITLAVRQKELESRLMNFRNKREELHVTPLALTGNCPGTGNK
jgi:predicted translin family RNA/ssDNA-binding protein